MGTKVRLGRSVLLLLGVLSWVACSEKGGDTPSKDESRNERSDDDDAPNKKTKKKKSKKADEDDAAAPKADAVFTARDPQIGDKSEQTSKQAMSMVVEVGGRKNELDELTIKEKVEEVVDVAQGRTAKIKVSYLKRSKRKSQGGKENTEVEPIAGKTYIVEDDGTGGPKVTSDDGSPVPPNERKLVEKDFRRTFKAKTPSADIEKALLAAKLEEGKRVSSAEAAFAAYFAEDDAGEDPGKSVDISDVKLVYRGIKGDRALFDIAFTMNVEEKRMVIMMPLKGQLEVRRKGVEPIAMTLKGPVEVDASKMPVPVQLTGELTMDLSETFTPGK